MLLAAFMRVTERPASKATPAWHTLVLAMATATLTYGAGRLMFSAYMFYDDEGYVLMSLKNFAEQGGLYRDIYSQYGPFPFVLYYVLHALGLPFTHFSERVLTLGVWILCAVCCAAIVRHLTRNLLLSLAVLAATCCYLWIMVSEPSHPGGLIAGVVAISSAFGARWLAGGRIKAWAVITGAAAALVALTKINVGGFIVLSGLAWILLHHESDVVRRRARWLLITGAVLVPIVLMRPMLAMDWIQTLAFVFACSTIAATLATDSDAPTRVNWSALGWCVIGGTVSAAAVLVVVFARGTGVMELIEGILLGPIRHPAAFNLSYTWPTGSAAFALVSLLTCITALVLRRRGVAAVERMVAGLRLVAVGGAIAAALRYPAASPDRLIFGFGAPCTWLFLWRLPGEAGATKATLAWLVLLWLGQYLHTYPVAGSQIAWGTYLALPIAAIGGYDTVRWIAARIATGTVGRMRAIFVAGQIALAALAALLGVRFVQSGERYRVGSNLGLPGADLLRLPSPASALFRVLALNATAYGDVLFSEPGMFSLNFWSGVPPPTLANATHWFSLIGPAHQQEIIKALDAHPRACVIIAREHIEYLTRRSFAPAGALHDYIARNFSPAFTLDHFEFCVRNGRHIDPLLLGEMQVFTDVPRSENTALRIRMIASSGPPIARIEIAMPDGSRPIVFNASNARVEVDEPSPRTLPWPLQIRGTATLSVRFDRFVQPRPTAGSLIVFRAADGSEVALGRLKE